MVHAARWPEPHERDDLGRMLTCPACEQSFQVPDAPGNMQDALDVIEAHAAAHPGHLNVPRA
jgi:hypothetical protein